MKLMFLLGLFCFTLGASEKSVSELINQCNIFIDPDKLSANVDVAEFHDDLAFAFYYQLSASDINVPQLHVAKMLSIYLPELSEFCEHFNVRKITLSPKNPYNFILIFNNKVQKDHVFKGLSDIAYIHTIQFPKPIAKQTFFLTGLGICATVGMYQLIKKIGIIPFLT